MKFQMIIAACLVLGAQFASAVAKSDCQMNDNKAGTGVKGQLETKREVDTTIKVQTAEAKQTPATATK